MTGLGPLLAFLAGWTRLAFAFFALGLPVLAFLGLRLLLLTCFPLLLRLALLSFRAGTALRPLASITTLVAAFATPARFAIALHRLR